MKKKLVKKFLAGILVASMCVTQVPYGMLKGTSVVYATETDLLTDGSFENTSVVLSDKWNISGVVAGEYSGADHHGEGSSCLKLTFSNEGNGNGYVYAQNGVSVESGATYTISGYAKLVGEGQATVFAGDKYSGESATVEKNDWVSFSYTIKASEETIYPSFGIWGNSGTELYIDDLTFVKVADAEDTSGNLLQNASFESKINGEWVLQSKKEDAAVKGSVVKWGNKDGSYSYQLLNEDAGGEGYEPPEVWLTQNIDTLEAGTYDFTIYAMGKSGSGAKAVVSGNVIDSPEIGYKEWNDWGSLTYSFTVEEEVNNFSVGVCVPKLWTGTDGYYIDNLSLVSVPEESVSQRISEAKTSLKKCIDACASLDEAGYTTESWSAFREVLESAEAEYNKSETRIEFVQSLKNAENALNTAKEALVIDDGLYYVDIYKEDYSSTEDTGWTSVWTPGLTDANTKDGDKDWVTSGYWNTWASTAQHAKFTKTFEGLKKGNYRLTFIAKSGKCNNAKIKVDENEQSITLDANDSNVPMNFDFTVAEDGDVTVEMNIDYEAGGWCNFDNVKLQKPVDKATMLQSKKNELQSLISECDALNNQAYTDTSWKPLASALSLAKEELAKTNATIDSLEKAITELKLAKCHLKEKIYVKKVEGLSDDFIRGVDISSYISIKDSGATFKDENGNVLTDDKEFFKLLKDSGVNYVRVRIWNDPYTADRKGYGGGNSDLAKAKIIGKLAADAGMKTLVDFHYSDFWADPERQYSPKAWREYEKQGTYGENCNDGKYTEKTVAEKETLLYNYTYDSLVDLIDAGVNVGMVQVGNETNNGMAGVQAEGDWSDVCKLYKKGSEAVRKVAEKKGQDILVALHFTDPQTIGKYDEFAGKLAANEVDYDVFASSYYPNIHGSMENLTNVLSGVATKYNKKVMVAETAWAWTTMDGDGTNNNVNPGTNPDYSNTVQGQANEIRDVVQAVHNIGKAGIGVFYWEPAWIPVQYAYDIDGNLDSSIQKSNEEKQAQYGSGWASVYSGEYDPEHGGKYPGGSVKDADAFFDFEGNPLSSLTIFRDIYNGRTGAGVEVDIIKDAEAEVLLQTSDVTSAIDTIKAALPSTVTAINNDSTRVSLPVIWDITKVNAINDFGTYSISGTVSYKDKEGNEKTASVSCELNILPKSIVKNGDFEAGNEGWTVSDNGKVSIVWNDTPLRGTGAMHYWSPGVVDFTLTQSVTVEEAGIYRASLQGQGGDGDPNVIGIQIKNLKTQDSKEASATLTGHEKWKKAIAEGLRVQAGDTVQITITVSAAEGGWGSIDDVFLYKIGEYSGSTSGGGSGSTPTTPPTDSKPDSSIDNKTETGVETKPDGSTVETTTETKEDGTKVETTTETATDGSKTETVVETKPDGTKVETITETATDGSKVETKKESETNTAGKQVDVATVTKTDADGSVTSVVEKSTINEIAENTTATVTVKKDGEGAVTSATASVVATIEGKKTSLSVDVIAQVQEASGQKDVAVTVTAKNDEGKTLYKVKVDTKDLTAKNALYIYKVDSKTGELVMVNSKTYKVDENGGLDISIKNKATYELVSKEEAKAIEKQIKATVKVQNSSKDVKKGKTTKVAFDKKMNMNNVKSITYQTADKKIATVSKSGKVTAKAKGTVTVKATVTLKNGSKKTVTMKIKVK